MELTDAVQRRAKHKPNPNAARQCAVCGERHPCREWRLARAAVLVAVRRAFAAARRGEAL